MSDPVVLIGFSRDDVKLVAVGLYATQEAAREAVHRGNLPDGHYSVFTPKIGESLAPVQFPRKQWPEAKVAPV